MLTLLLLVVIFLIGLLIAGSVFAPNIAALVRRHLPDRDPTSNGEGEELVLWGGMLLIAFTAGLLTMYLVLKW